MKRTSQTKTIDYRVLILDGYRVEYLIRRHPKARHLRLQVNPFDGVVVTMPLKLPRYINPDSFVRDNKEWVLQKLKESGRISVRPDGQGIRGILKSGDSFLYRGKLHRIYSERLSVSTPHVLLNRNAQVVSVYLPRSTQESINSALKEWLYSEAKSAILSTAAEWSREIGVNPGRITIRGQRTKWGSCSADGNLTFNWRLILFPPMVLRYVVVHELCHLKHFDHSVSFWRLVHRHIPEYRRAVDWLQTEGVNAKNLLVEL